MKTKERFFGILLGLALMLVLTAGMSAGAYAATPYPVWVGGVQVTSVNMKDVLGDGKVSFTPADGGTPATLTLDGANITSTGSENSHNGAAIYADEDLTVFVEADSTVTGPNNKSDDSYGIFTYDKLNVTGPGTLTATGGEAKGINGFSYGVYAGDVTVSGTLIGTGSEANHDSCGVNAEFGDVTVAEGCELIAMAGEATSGSSYGVHASEAVTVNGILNAESGTAANGSSYGVYADRAVTVNGTGTLNAASSEALGSYGVNTEYGDVIVEDGGTLNAEGGATLIGSSYGVFAYGAVTVNGILNAESGAAAGDNGDSYGVYAVGAVTVNGALSGTGSGADRYSCGVSSKGDVTVAEGGELTAMAGAADIDSSGVSASGAVTVRDAARLRATGNTQAISGSVRNFIAGTGWTNTEGTEYRTEIAVSADPRPLTDFKHVRIPTLYDVWVGGVQVTGLNAGDVLDDGTVSYTPAEGTAPAILTLNGAAIRDSYENAAIFAEVDLTVFVETDSAVTSPDSESNSCGILTYGDLNVTGHGTLTATAGEAKYISYGVRAEAGDVTVAEGSTLTAAAGAVTNGPSYGVYAVGAVNVNGTLTAEGGAAKYTSCGVYAVGDITVNGTLTAEGDKSTKSPSYGVYTVGAVNVNGTLTATGAEATGENGYSYGVNAYEDVTVNGTLTATGSAANRYSYGVYARRGAVNVAEDGGLTATAGTVENGSSYGVSAVGAVTVNGTLNAEGGAAKYTSCGVYAVGDITVSGTLTATGDKSTNSPSYGVYTEEGAVNVAEGGTLTATGAEATGENGYSYGVYAYEDVTVNGELTATGSAANRYSYGVSTEGDVTVAEDGELTATAGTAENGSSYGVHAIGPVTVSGTLDAESGTAANGFSYGVRAFKTITVNGTLTATSSEAFCSYGVNSVYGDVTVTRGGELTATSGTAEIDSSGVSAFENVTVAKGGVLTATGGTASDTDGDSSGVSAASGDVTVSGELTATSSEAFYSYGVYAAETVTVSTTARLTAAGDTEAVSGSVKNAIVGTGWTDAAGTTGQAYLAVSTEGRSLNYRKLLFPGSPAPAYDTPDFTLPGSIETIEANAFEGAAMTVVYIPDTCTAIGAGAFKDCSKLTQIRIPEGCEIGEGAFEDCNAVYIYAPVGSPAQSFCADPANANCIFCEAAE